MSVKIEVGTAAKKYNPDSKLSYDDQEHEGWIDIFRRFRDPDTLKGYLKIYDNRGCLLRCQHQIKRNKEICNAWVAYEYDKAKEVIESQGTKDEPKFRVRCGKCKRSTEERDFDVTPEEKQSWPTGNFIMEDNGVDFKERKVSIEPEALKRKSSKRSLDIQNTSTSSSSSSAANLIPMKKLKTRTVEPYEGHQEKIMIDFGYGSADFQKVSNVWDEFAGRNRTKENPCLFDRFLRVEFMDRMYLQDLYSEDRDVIFSKSESAREVSEAQDLKDTDDLLGKTSMSENPISEFPMPQDPNFYSDIPSLESFKKFLTNKFPFYGKPDNSLFETVEKRALLLDLIYFVKLTKVFNQFELTDDEKLHKQKYGFSDYDVFTFKGLWYPCPFFKSRTELEIMEIMKSYEVVLGDMNMFRIHQILRDDVEEGYPYSYLDSVARFQAKVDLLKYLRKSKDKSKDLQKYKIYQTQRWQPDLPLSTSLWIPDLPLNAKNWLSPTEHDLDFYEYGMSHGRVVAVQQNFLAYNIAIFSKGDNWTPTDLVLKHFDPDYSDNMSDIYKELMIREFMIYQDCNDLGETEETKDLLKWDEFFLPKLNTLNEIVEAGGRHAYLVMKIFAAAVSQFFPEVLRARQSEEEKAQKLAGSCRIRKS